MYGGLLRKTWNKITDESRKRTFPVHTVYMYDSLFVSLRSKRFQSSYSSKFLFFFALVPTFLMNSRGNACYAGYLFLIYTALWTEVFLNVFPPHPFFFLKRKALGSMLRPFMYAPVVPAKNTPDSRPKWAKCFQTKNAQKPGAVHTYIAYIREYPQVPPPFRRPRPALKMSEENRILVRLMIQRTGRHNSTKNL